MIIKIENEIKQILSIYHFYDIFQKVQEVDTIVRQVQEILLDQHVFIQKVKGYIKDDSIYSLNSIYYHDQLEKYYHALVDYNYVFGTFLHSNNYKKAQSIDTLYTSFQVSLARLTIASKNITKLPLKVFKVNIYKESKIEVVEYNKALSVGFSQVIAKGNFKLT
ncbi:hypothetical protein K502DRAFT_345460 [Neoconidiobolus thromboides FSU 785]|nr:hypothetical protein K502DRAFT_345460 [Neoconidiobolus thromboides FSU 785]